MVSHSDDDDDDDDDDDPFIINAAGVAFVISTVVRVGVVASQILPPKNNFQTAEVDHGTTMIQRNSTNVTLAESKKLSRVTLPA